MKLTRRSAEPFPEDEARFRAARRLRAAQRRLAGASEVTAEGDETAEEPVGEGAGDASAAAGTAEERAYEAEAEAEARLAEHAAALERAAKAHGEHLSEQAERRYRELADWVRELVERLRLDAQAQLAESATSIKGADEERAQRTEAVRDRWAREAEAARAEEAASRLAALEQDAEERAQLAETARAERALRADAARTEEVASQLAEGREMLEQLAAELRERAAGAGREAAEASATAERRVLKQAEDLYSKAERALAQTDALAEQLAELSSSLGARRAQTARNGIRGNAKLRAVPRASPLDANEATLDELREMELSLTQATRILEYRDSLGGFTSVDELDEVPGISKALRADLKRKLIIPTAA